MELQEAIKNRRSVRRFTEDAISKETILEIVDIARMAPSWKNTQTTRYIIVTDREIIDKIANEAVLGFEHNQKTLLKAGALVVVTSVAMRSGYERDGSFTTSKGQGWEMFDAGIATQTFALAAHEKGLGTVIMGIFDEAKVKEIVNVPENQNVSCIMPIGVPKFAPEPTPRKEVSDLVSFI